MATSVKLSDKLISEARIKSKVFNRSLSGQIEHWAKIGKLAEENPDLTYEFIMGILVSIEEAKAGKVEPYDFGE